MKRMLLGSLFVCCLSLGYSQSGEPDPSFGTNGIVNSDVGAAFNYSFYGNQVLLCSDGGMCLIYESEGLIVLSKKHADGSPDMTFGNNGISVSLSIYGSQAALQTDGKIVVAGYAKNANHHGNVYDFEIARFNANGSLDKSFGEEGIQITDLGNIEFATTVAIQQDGKIVVAGNQIVPASTTGEFLVMVRYNINGSVDNGFANNGILIEDFGNTGGNVTSIAIQGDGKIVLAGNRSLYRFNENGSLDTGFNGNGKLIIDGFAKSMVIQNDDKIITCGNYTLNGIDHGFSICRINSNGSLDSTFSGDGVQITVLGGIDNTATSLAIQNNGKIGVVGNVGNGNNKDFVIALFNPDGSPDIHFSSDGIQITDFNTSDDFSNSIAIQNDGKIVAMGYSVNGEHTNIVVSRYDTNGNLDTSFDTDGKLSDHINEGNTFYTSSAIQSNGKMVAAGYTWNGSNYDFVVVRYNINGSLDNTFSGDGIQITDFGNTHDKARSITIQSDGKILAAGSTGNDFALVRYNADGSLDYSFGGDGMQTTDFGSSDSITSVIVQQDGKILAGGSGLAQYNSNGSLDLSFNGTGMVNKVCDALALQKDGKIVVLFDNAIFRFNFDGTPDVTFGDNGMQFFIPLEGDNEFINKSIAIQNDGKIIIGGAYGYDWRDINYQFALLRLNSDGSFDNTFNGGQVKFTGINIYAFGNSVLIQGDKKIILGGYSYNGYSDHFTIARYNENGSLDNTFSGDGIMVQPVSGANDRIASLAITSDGLYAVGYGQYPGNFGVVARYLLSAGGPLPVTITNFTANMQAGVVQLQWQTASEQDLAGFTVQRSADNNNFSSIGYVLAKGNSSVKINYSTMDQHPLWGINFYRLKMVDKDAKFTYSKIVSVVNNHELFSLHLFPNPTKNILFVSATSENEKATFQIIDAGGSVLKSGSFYLFGNTTFAVNIVTLPKGIYYFQLVTKSKIETRRFVKD